MHHSSESMLLSFLLSEEQMLAIVYIIHHHIVRGPAQKHCHPVARQSAISHLCQSPLLIYQRPRLIAPIPSYPPKCIKSHPSPESNSRTPYPLISILSHSPTVIFPRRSSHNRLNTPLGLTPKKEHVLRNPYLKSPLINLFLCTFAIAIVGVGSS